MRILIAEDDLTARTILIGLLKKWGYDLCVVVDGPTAWKTLQQTDAPLLVILDWMMPGMDGLEVTRQVRARLTEQPPYIILITGRDQKGDISIGLEAGANDYIKKPFDHDELLARIRVGQRSLELQASNLESKQLLARLAIYDSLTGILNRRGLLDQFLRELARVRRGVLRSDDALLSVGFFDIDSFKLINDQHGHQVGDEVLKGVVGLITSQLRVYDIFGRLGGDEFLVIAPETNGEKSGCLYERLLTTVNESVIHTSAGELSITLSLGVVSPGPNEELEKILDRADKAMYQAKRRGGNQVFFGSATTDSK